MKKTLADFRNLTKAEATLVNWLQAGNRKVCKISNSVPNSANDDVTLRATFIRYLALGGCDACPLPETGLRVKGAHIVGDEKHSESTLGLDLYGCALRAELHLKQCRIPDGVCLEMARGISFDFKGSFFGAGLDARGLKATGGIQLNECCIRGTISLLGASLAGSFDANPANFTQYVKRNLDRDGIQRSIDCRGLKLGGGFRIMGARMAEALDLTGAQITGNLNIRDSVGGVDTDQYGATKRNKAKEFLVAKRIAVSGDVDLRNCRGPRAIVSYSKIDGDLLLQLDGKQGNCYFSELDLQGAVIGQHLKYRAAQAPNTDIKLQGLSVDRLDDRFDDHHDDELAHWPVNKNLSLNGIRIVTFEGGTSAATRIAWLRDRGDEFLPQPWEETAKVLREMGHGTDATRILIKKEELQRRARRSFYFEHGQDPIGWWFYFWDIILWVTTRYGRKPLWAIAFLFGFWVFGALTFGQAAQRGAIKPNLPQIQRAEEWVECADKGARRLEAHAHQVDCFHHQPEGTSYPRLHAAIYSADTLIPVVSLEMQSYWIPDASHPDEDNAQNYGKLARGYLWLHIFAGWALTLLAVAGFSGLIKTDNTK